MDSGKKNLYATEMKKIMYSRILGKKNSHAIEIKELMYNRNRKMYMQQRINM